MTGRAGGGEIRALRRAFNRLTGRLREREDALIETMQRYQLITENSTDLITKHAPDGTIIYASPVSISILGIPASELVGHSLCEFVHPDDFSTVRAAVTEAVQSKSVTTIMYRARHADQHYVWLETTLQRMRIPPARRPSAFCAFHATSASASGWKSACTSWREPTI